MSRFLQHYQRGRPALTADDLERSLMELVEPAAQRSATDLFVLTHGRQGHSGTKKEFYEVTFVQFFYQYILMSPSLRSYGIRWEAPFDSQGNNPKRVDLVLESQPTPQQLTMLVSGHEKLPGDGHVAARWRT